MVCACESRPTVAAETAQTSSSMHWRVAVTLGPATPPRLDHGQYLPGLRRRHCRLELLPRASAPMRINRFHVACHVVVWLFLAPAGPLRPNRLAAIARMRSTRLGAGGERRRLMNQCPCCYRNFSATSRCLREPGLDGPSFILAGSNAGWMPRRINFAAMSSVRQDWEPLHTLRG
jgi:hypothetical protein